MDMGTEMDPDSDAYLWEETNKALNDSANYNESYYYDDDNDTSSDPDIFSVLPDFLLRYDTFHYSIHAYLSLAVIIFGTIANIINIIVLTRKKMISPINDILTALAFADMMVLVCYLVKIQFHSPSKFMAHTDDNYYLAVFCLYLRNSYRVSHALSVWLTLVAAIWRVMGVCYSVATMGWRNRCRARVAIVSTYVVITIIYIPEYLLYTVNTTKNLDNSVEYAVVLSDMYEENKFIFDAIDTWVFEVFIKFLPCIPLTGLTLTLICKIYMGNKARRKLNVSAECDESRDRTTRILIVILVFFLLTKVPAAIIFILNFVLRYKLASALHFLFSGTVNVLVLFNSAINFIVYCSMSSQFRDTLSEVISSCKCCMGNTDKTKKQTEDKGKKISK